MILDQNQNQDNHERHAPWRASILLSRLLGHARGSNHVWQPVPHGNIGYKKQSKWQQVKE
ncbi:hypothetical protein Hanom_Chr14g01253151 [Helianthus anomalus]